MAAGVKQPRAIVAHGMWVDPAGRKMSKTLGNTIELDVLNRHFSIDAIRYFCLREMVFGQDGRFGYENLIDRTNSDLASGLGNLSSRTLTMIQRYCEGRVPSGNISEEGLLPAKRAGVDTDETTISGFISHARDEFIHYFDNFGFSRALEEVWAIVARADKMISDAKPWNLAAACGAVSRGRDSALAERAALPGLARGHATDLCATWINRRFVEDRSEATEVGRPSRRHPNRRSYWTLSPFG